jgi:hypothetical protein
VNTEPLSLWKGVTVHERTVPFRNRFSYTIVLIDLDIDRLEEASASTWLFNVNKPGLFSFRTRDHGAHTDGPLRPWAEAHFSRAGVSLGGGMIRLVTFPRHLGYKFAPISLWYGYDPGGTLRGILYEVNNTFGETHIYAAAVDANLSQHAAEKVFHVSPFFDISGTYQFTARAPDNHLSLVVSTTEKEARQHTASIKARRLPASAGNLARLALTNPLSTLGVTAGIHWEALKLWMRGARYRPRPALPASSMTLAEPAPHKDAA